MILLGDCRSLLPTLDAGSVRCCVTSPPYWGLRDYGTATWEGGSEECDHSDPGARDPKDRRASTLGGGVATIAAQTAGSRARETCYKCGARRIDAQLGLEKTPEEYVAAMVGVFREVRRVLAEDGTLWLNLGDSYVSVSGSQTQGANGQMATRTVAQVRDNKAVHGTVKRPPSINGLLPKNLVGIPWRVAFALQADGWYLRSDIIWAKPNPMPESVTDRPTKAHEYVFLLSKSAKYFYDAGAIAERVEHVQPPRRFGRKEYEIAQAEHGHAGARAIALETGQGTDSSMGNHFGRVFGGETTRNARSIWTIPTQPTPDAHFATFPEALAERCILAGSAHGDTILDPFFGSGTVGKVAEQLGRKWIGCELNPEYVGISERKTAQMGLFLESRTGVR